VKTPTELDTATHAGVSLSPTEPSYGSQSTYTVEWTIVLTLACGWYIEVP